MFTPKRTAWRFQRPTVMGGRHAIGGAGDQDEAGQDLHL